MKKRFLSILAAAALLVSFSLTGLAPVPAAADGIQAAEIGWMASFDEASLSQWRTQKLDGLYRFTLADPESTVTAYEPSNDGHSIRLCGGYKFGEMTDYPNDYYMIAQQVTVNLDETPYLYANYTYHEQGQDSQFQVVVHQGEQPHNTDDSVTMVPLSSADFGTSPDYLTVEGTYRKLDVAGALELVRHLVAGGDAEKVRRVHVRAVGEADGKRLGL